jgi:hypothetical protein
MEINIPLLLILALNKLLALNLGGVWAIVDLASAQTMHPEWYGIASADIAE